MRAVFHLSTDDPAVHDRLVGNVGNLLDDETVDLDAVAVVANSGGLDLVLADAPSVADVEGLLDRGVAVKTCRNTLDARGLGADRLLDGVEVVPSVVGELVRLQAADYAYLRP